MIIETPNYQLKVTTLYPTPTTTDTYVGKATVGSLQSEAVWQAKRILDDGENLVVTWANGDTNFDNVATDLSALTYS